MSKWYSFSTLRTFDTYEEARNDVSNYLCEDDVYHFIWGNATAEELASALNGDMPGFYQKMREELLDIRCKFRIEEVPDNTDDMEEN